jgi:hypothetical protein
MLTVRCHIVIVSYINDRQEKGKEGSDRCLGSDLVLHLLWFRENRKTQVGLKAGGDPWGQADEALLITRWALLPCSGTCPPTRHHRQGSVDVMSGTQQGRYGGDHSHAASLSARHQVQPRTLGCGKSVYFSYFLIL